MARPNIEERREAVQKTLADRDYLPTNERNELAKAFSCTPSAIYQDEVMFYCKKMGVKTTVYVSQRLKVSIRERDGEICQYCGDRPHPTHLVVEHVIPSCKGGHGRAYNLVLSCHSCNMKKRSEVWIPKNIEVLRKLNPAWVQRIMLESNHKSPQDETCAQDCPQPDESSSVVSKDFQNLQTSQAITQPPPLSKDGIARKLQTIALREDILAELMRQATDRNCSLADRVNKLLAAQLKAPAAQSQVPVLKTVKSKLIGNSPQQADVLNSKQASQAEAETVPSYGDLEKLVRKRQSNQGYINRRTENIQYWRKAYRQDKPFRTAVDQLASATHPGVLDLLLDSELSFASHQLLNLASSNQTIHA